MHGRAEYIMIGLLLLGISSATTFGQTEVKTLYLKDGSTIQGKIVAQDDSTLVVETPYGTLEIERASMLTEESWKKTVGRSTALEVETIYLKDGSNVRGTVMSGESDPLVVRTDKSEVGRKVLGVAAIVAGAGFGVLGAVILNPNNNLKDDSEYGVMAIADGVGLVALGIWLLSTPNGGE